jgi:Putative peptidoglycan binding domain
LGFTIHTPNELTFAKAVARWQQSQGLPADGMIGPNTWSWMQEALSIQNALRRGLGDAPNGKECKKSPIRIEVRRAKALSGTLSKHLEQVMLAGSAIQIIVPKTATAVLQNETIEAALKWACPGGKSGTEKGTHKIQWSSVEGQQPGGLETTDEGEKLALDGHLYGLLVKPGSDLRESAEKNGFDMGKCNWELVENFKATTSAAGGSKILHRCTWGFRFNAKHRIGRRGRVSKKASVKYWGVDKEIES